MYKIDFSTKAAKIYMKLPEDIRQLINIKFDQIAKDPYAKHDNVKPLKNMKGCFRLRIGSWRIVYEIVNERLKIYVINIGKRSEIYRGT